MPCFGTTHADALQRGDPVSGAVASHFREIPIADTVRSQLSATSAQDEAVRDVTYENGQARVRTLELMDLANRTGGLVIGTGDLQRAGARLGHLQRRPYEHVRRQRRRSQDAGASHCRATRPTAPQRAALRERPSRHSRHARQPGAASRRRKRRDRAADGIPRRPV